MFGMIKNHFQRVRKTARGVSERDIDILGDEFARSVDWKPMWCMGGPITIRRLHGKRNGDIVFRPTFLVLLLAAAFAWAGLFIMRNTTRLYFTFHDVVSRPVDLFMALVRRIGQISGTDSIYGFILGVCALGFGVFMLFVCLQSIVFRKAQREFKKGLPLLPARRVAFDDIYAVQLVAKLPIKPNYINYQMNLVLKNSSRVHLFAHGNRNQTRADAAGLARFLGVPLWDVT